MRNADLVDSAQVTRQGLPLIAREALMILDGVGPRIRGLPDVFRKTEVRILGLPVYEDHLANIEATLGCHIAEPS
jgi:2-keto-3-deoxy-galactonokinase